ncbi:hypothetical protein BY458DRAFT_470377 [Sporodiniella umbellata]|nr:hypothetical protein BY458DRAFT_470377 [Sporodiniella umbellata]
MEPKSSYDDTENSNPSSVHPLDLSGMIPLTTEEPVRRLWLKKELEKVNNPETHGATKEGIAFASPPAPQGQNKIENSEESVRVKGEDIMVCLSRQISDYQEEAEESEEEDIDPELLDTTEKNKHIPYEPTPPISRDASDQSIHHQSDQVRNQLLVFAEHVTVDESPNRRTVAHFYGAGIHGSLPSHLESRPSRRIYMLAYDFSAESVNALEWAIGSIMRDGDEIHIAVVSNRDDNPEIVKASGLDKKSELSKISMAVTTKAKEVMGKMMLFNVKLVTHAMMGRVKDKLNTLVSDWAIQS